MQQDSKRVIEEPNPDDKTVYVGNFEYRFGRMKMYHMACANLDALHAMADKIGIARKWFQNIEHHPHYDISKGKRALAVSLGAVEVSDKVLIRLCYGDLIKKLIKK